jgi:hypothetical protein
MTRAEMYRRLRVHPWHMMQANADEVKAKMNP